MRFIPPVNNNQKPIWRRLVSDRLNKDSFAQVYEEATPGSTISLTSASVFYPWVTGGAGMTNNAEVDSGAITVKSTGYYLCLFAVSASSNKVATIHTEAHVNGVAKDEVSNERKFPVTDIGSFGSSGVLSLSSGDVVDLRFESDTSATTVTIRHASLTLIQLG